MKREEILRQYKVHKSGVIESPGKFEGEMLYVPYFWEDCLAGEADDDIWEPGGFQVSVVRIIQEDRDAFPELGKVHTIHLWEDEQGFVRTEEF
jgi:hypothetical protein